MTHDINTYSQEKYGTPTDEQLAARKRWVEVLRSGKYRQLAGALADAVSPSRCCLGVACDPVVIGIDLDVRKTQWGPAPRLEFADAGAYNSTTLPKRAGEALGFGPYVTVPRVVLSGGVDAQVTRLNDQGTSFEEIADLIEATHITPFERMPVCK